MKKTRKILSLALCILLLTAVIPLGTFPVAAAETSGSCGENLTWKYDSSTYTLTISGTGAMANYRYVYYDNGTYVTNAPWQAYYNTMKTLVIEDGVTTIGEYAFCYCTGLTSVTIGDSVTTIGNYAFRNCDGLTSVTIPNSVTSIGDGAFYYCTGLTEIHWNAKAVADFDYESNVFYNAGTAGNGITVTFGDSVEKIPAYLFYVDSYFNRPNIKSVTIGDSVTTIGSAAFYNCTGLTEINWNAKAVADFTSNSNVFYNAGTAGDGITVTFGDSVEKIPAYLFYINSWVMDYCPPKIISVTIPDSVTTIGGSAFSGCTGLTSVTIPDSVTTIGNEAFDGCTGLTSVTIGNSVTTIGDYAFEYCTGLTSVTIGNSVTTIGWYAFRNCTGLTSVTIGDSVTTIGYEAFSGCKGLTRVDITDLAAWCNISFDYFFANPLYYAHNLYLNGKLVTDLVIPNGVTEINNYAFYNCRGLSSVTIPNSVTSIGNSAFSGCPVTIYGFAGSAAERYAAANGFSFVAFPEMIEIFTLPKTEYGLYEKFDPYHLIIMVYYPDGTAQLRYRGYEVTGFDSAKVGTQTVTVSYLGATTTFQVTVADGMAENPPTVEDLAHCSRAILGYEKPTEADDYNGDGVCDVRDLVRLKKMMAA